MHRFLSFLLLATVTYLLLPVSRLSAQIFPCDPELETQPGDALGYRLRGERCEGLYVQKVASTTLVLASFLARTGLSSSASWEGEALNVEWTVPPAGGNAPESARREAVASTRLRAQGLRPRLYYRMDAERPAGAAAFTWPTDLLTRLRILPREVGLVAWTERTLGGKPREVYLPLTVRSAGPGGGGYLLVLRPGRELSEVYLSLAPLDRDGLLGEFLKDSEPLSYGYYPAGHGTEIELPALPAAGFYHLELGARFASGGVTAIELVFYHPG